MMKTKKIILSVIAFFITANIFAVPEIDLTELLNSENMRKIVPELQREITIVETTSGNLDLNPLTSSYVTEARILNGIYEGLYSYNAQTMEPDNALAQDVRISRDKLRWTFTIRENAKFSNGKTITAQSVKDSWLALLSTPDAYYASLLDVIRGAKAFRTGKGKAEEVAIFANGNKLVITLEKPLSYLPRILCHHAFSVVDPEGGFSGAYYIEAMDPLKLILKKNDFYWDKENVALPGITIICSRDEDYVTHAFNTGTVDIISSGFDPKKILSKKSLQLSAEFGTQFLFFKNREGIWSDPDFRNAVLTAIPWEALRAGSTFPALTLVPALGRYQSPEGLNYSDIDEAKMLLEEAKKKAGIDKDERLTLTFAVGTGDYLQGQAELLRKALEPIGVDVKTLTIPDEYYIASISSAEADLISYTWIGDYSDPTAFLELFRSDSSMNESGWKNEEFDRLMDEAAFTTNSTEHNSLLSKAEDVLLSSGEIIPIVHPLSCCAISLDDIGGWTVNAMDVHPYKALYIKENKISIPNVVMLTK